MAGRDYLFGTLLAKVHSGSVLLGAVSNVNDVLGPVVLEMDPSDQRAVGGKMIDIGGTKNKSSMGANG